MTIRREAIAWLAKNRPSETHWPMRSSKFYKEQELWFLTFPTAFLNDQKPGYLLILLEDENKANSFHALRIPFEFLRENRSKFDVRVGGEKFDLHISGRKSKWMVDLRSQGVDFRKFSI
jgi:hypothetical protein